MISINAITNTLFHPNCACDPTFLLEMGLLAQHETIDRCHVNISHCNLIHSFTTISFLLLLVVATYHAVSFWLSVSDKLKGNIHLLYVSFISACILRSLRHMLIQYTSATHELLNFLYYAPLILMFTSVSILLLSWQEMFSLVTGKGANATPQLLHFTIIGNVFVACSTLVLLQMDSRLCPIPVFLACPIVFYLYQREGFSKWRAISNRAKSPRAKSFPFVTSMIVLMIVGVFLYSTVGVGFLIANFTSYSKYSHALRHIVHVLEAFLGLFLLFVLRKFVGLCVLPMPETFDSEWLTAMFREKGAMRHTNYISNIHGEKKLTGGCHSAVRKMELSFLEKTDWLPSAVVVKVLAWEKSFYEKLCLSIRATLGGSFETKEVTYLKSYAIEAKFYEEIGPEVHGIKIPRVYYNHNDRFNNRFGMVMEDITFCEGREEPPVTGQPFGFTFSDTRAILSQLARFHAWFWEHPDLASYDVWDVAGYYTGTKRLQFKDCVEMHWEKVMHNLGSELGIEDKEKFGARLYHNRQALNTVYDSKKRKTIVHGDYKISNIFVEQSKSPNNHQLAKCTSNDGGVYVIDWQWVGRGCAAVDVAYYLATSTEIDTVKRSSMKKLVKIYHSILVEKGVKNYTFKEMWADFRLAFVDFIVYVISCKWSAMTAADFISNQNQCKDGLHIRSLIHAKQLITIADGFMDSLGFAK